MAVPVLCEQGASYSWQLLLNSQSVHNLWAYLIGPAFPAPANHGYNYGSLSAIELVAPGYSHFVLPAVDWSIMTIMQGAQALTQAAQYTFTGAAVVTGGWVGWDDIGVAFFYWGFFDEGAFNFPAAGGQFYTVISPTLISVP